jgi:hypothetical protein
MEIFDPWCWMKKRLGGSEIELSHWFEQHEPQCMSRRSEVNNMSRSE